MKLRTEINVSIGHYQRATKYSFLTAILIFLPELLLFIGGNFAVFSDSFAEALLGEGGGATEETTTSGSGSKNTASGGSSTTQKESMDISFGSSEGIMFFGNDTISFWSDVTNNDSLKIKKGGVVIFYGETWENSNGHLQTEGLLCMSSPRPAPYANNFTQVLSNGGQASTLPLLIIDNPNNVEMANDLSVTDTLIFKQGKLILDGHNLAILNPHADAIKGYNENSYVVTGNEASGGHLTRYGVSNTIIDFPVGPTTDYYAPASLKNKGTTDNFSVRAFGGVYEEGDTGKSMDDYGVGVTWDIQEDSAGGSKLNIALQHDRSKEGSSFNANNHFVSRYIGTPNNTEGDTLSGSAWDLLFKSNTGSGSNSGTITTGSSISNAVVTSRSGITKMGLFTKVGYASGGALPVKLLYYTTRAKGDYNSIRWATSMEVNSYFFTLERSNDGTLFEEMTTIGGAGNSYDVNNYVYEDMRPYDVTYYRLSQTDYDGTTEVLGVQVVKREGLITSELLIYPNPCTQSNLFVELPDQSDIESFVQIVDLSGKVLFRQTTDFMEEGEIITFNVDELPRGIYLVQRGNKGTLVTKKLIIPDGR